MNDLIVWRDKLQELYATKSIYIDKAVQFVLALVTFLMINQNIGLMKAVATPVVAVALAVICTFLPPVVTAYVAAGLVIVHLFKLSMGVAAAAALVVVDGGDGVVVITQKNKNNTQSKLIRGLTRIVETKITKKLLNENGEERGGPNYRGRG